MKLKRTKRMIFAIGLCMSVLLCGCVTDETQFAQKTEAVGETSEVSPESEAEALDGAETQSEVQSEVSSESMNAEESGAKDDTAKESGYEVTGTAEYTGEVYTYKVYEMRNSADEYDIYWQIDIYNGENPVQEIKAEKAEYLSLLPSVGELVHEEDVDFDGQKDLLIFRGLFGAQGAEGYDCYLIRGEEFVFCPGFAEIPNPMVDEEQQVIIGRNRNSASSYSELVYRFNGTDFEMIERRTYEYDKEVGGFVLEEE